MSSRSRAALQQAQAARRRRVRAAVLSIGAIVILLGGAVAVGVWQSGGSSGPSALADPSVVAAVTSVPAATLDAVGSGGVRQSLIALSHSAPTTGKPTVIYIGAEYCPFCAAERWSVVQALSRFGRWSMLSATTSATDDIFPATATFSFLGATYTSRYLAFEGVETRGNVKVNGQYRALQQLTPAQQSMLATYDAPPYVPQEAAGSIPFVSYGDRFASAGASFSPKVLAGMTASAIARALSDPASPQALAILGSANRLTAALCQLTGDQPADVCALGAVARLRKDLPGVS